MGIEGWLVRIDLQVRQADFSPPAGPLLFDLRPTIGGVPVADDTLALASVAIPAATIPSLSPLTGDFVSVDLNPFSLFVSPDDVLAIALRYPGTGNYVWLDQVGDLYARGAEYARRFSPSWGEIMPASDAGFRTFIPEPPIVVLLAAGLISIGWYQTAQSRSGKHITGAPEA